MPMRLSMAKKTVATPIRKRFRMPRWLRRFYLIGLGAHKRDFISNLATLLDSGMDALSALRVVRQELRSRRMRRIIAAIEESIESGVSLSRTLEKTQLFPARVIALLRLGEQSGKLIQNMQVVVTQYEKEWLLRTRVRSALLYATIVFSLTIIIGAGTAWFVLPQMATVFAGFDVELPLLTRWLMAVGAFLGEWGYIVIPAFLVVVGGAGYFLFSFPRTKYLGQFLLFKIPGIKTLILQVEVARFSYIMGTMLESGIPASDSLASLHDATTFRGYRRFYGYLRDSVTEGNSFKKSFGGYRKAYKLIPLSVQQMIVAAEQSGRLSETLLKIGQRFEVKTETAAKNISVLIEPILLIVIGAGVMVLALAVLLPITNLATAL